ncbi:MAG: hypothetical protein RLZ95_1706 [Bacteroidota bacterium]|jgi:hypothetical protein
MSTYKFVLSAVFCFILLLAHGQKDTLSTKKANKPKKEIKFKKDSVIKKVDTLKKDIIIKKDTSTALVDSLPPKDTIRIKYIPVLPISFIKADAWYFQKIHAKMGDTAFDIFKAYQNYFKDKKTGYQLYIKKLAHSNDLPALFKIEQRFAIPDKDLLFYLIIGLFLLYGLINNLFPQYYLKLFSQFSQSSIRDVQNREQLIQNSFASLITNIGFILSFSLMATLLIFNDHLLPISFWLALLYICIFFTLLYLGKFICLQLMGYIFNVRELVNTYIFVVFMINKVLGILLLPFVLMLAFSKPVFYSVAIGAGAILTVLLFLYRYLFTLTSVRNKLHISSFHFFLYLCAFEILPLLILYKFIVHFLGGTF